MRLNLCAPVVPLNPQFMIVRATTQSVCRRSVEEEGWFLSMHPTSPQNKTQYWKSDFHFFLRGRLSSRQRARRDDDEHHPTPQNNGTFRLLRQYQSLFVLILL